MTGKVVMIMGGNSTMGTAQNKTRLRCRKRVSY
jgi:hypothetical protein